MSKSKKRSEWTPPDPPVYFIDRSLGSRTVAEALRAVGHCVEVHDEHFAIDTRDEVWLRAVGAKGWIVLSKDDAIRRRVAEITALRSAGVCFFSLGRGEYTGPTMARLFAQAMPQIERVLRAHKPPMICTIAASGIVTVFEDQLGRLSKPKLVHPRHKRPR